MPEIVFQERWEVVQDELRRRILTGELPPGASLPETELAEEMGVSRGPVRAALRSLEVAGLVLRRGRRPSIVAPTTRQDVEELFSVRCAMDAFAVERAMERNKEPLQEALLANVASMAAGMNAAEVPTERLVEDDIAFHSKFYELADNRRLEGIWANLQDPVRLMMNLSLHLSEPHWSIVVSEHREIAEAVTAGDPERAGRAIRNHLDRAFRRADAYVQAHLEGGHPDETKPHFQELT